MENPKITSQTLDVYVTDDVNIEDGQDLFSKLIKVLPGCCHPTFEEAKNRCENKYGDIVLSVRKLKITFEQID